MLTFLRRALVGHLLVTYPTVFTAEGQHPLYSAIFAPCDPHSSALYQRRHARGNPVLVDQRSRYRILESGGLTGMGLR